METIESVKQEIAVAETQLSEVRKKIKDCEGRLRDAKTSSEKVFANMQSLKEKRQNLLAAGQDSSSVNGSIKKLADDAELKTDEIIGIENSLKGLQSTEANLLSKPEALRLRLLQIQSVELAKKYNELSGQLAEVAKGLNEIHFKIDGNGYNGKQYRVVFLPEDYINTIPRLFFDEGGLGLEDYVAKYPGQYHSNILCPDCEKYFYKWQTHKQRLIEQKTD